MFFPPTRNQNSQPAIPQGRNNELFIFKQIQLPAGNINYLHDKSQSFEDHVFCVKFFKT